MSYPFTYSSSQWQSAQGAFLRWKKGSLDESFPSFFPLGFMNGTESHSTAGVPNFIHISEFPPGIEHCSVMSKFHREEELEIVLRDCVPGISTWRPAPSVLPPDSCYWELQIYLFLDQPSFSQRVCLVILSPTSKRFFKFNTNLTMLTHSDDLESIALNFSMALSPVTTGAASVAWLRPPTYGPHWTSFLSLLCLSLYLGSASTCPILFVCWSSTILTSDFVQNPYGSSDGGCQFSHLTVCMVCIYVI